MKAMVRIEEDGSALLVFADGAAYSRRDGHTTATDGYIRKHTHAPRDDDDMAQAKRLVEHYNKLPGGDAECLTLVKRRPRQ